MKYPKVQYELDLNAKYACRFFEKNGFSYEIKRQSYEGDTFELRKDGITFSVKVPSNPKLNKKKYFEQLVQYFENVKDCEDFKRLYEDLFGNKENGKKMRNIYFYETREEAKEKAKEMKKKGNSVVMSKESTPYKDDDGRLLCYSVMWIF